MRGCGLMNDMGNPADHNRKGRRGAAKKPPATNSAVGKSEELVDTGETAATLAALESYIADQTALRNLQFSPFQIITSPSKSFGIVIGVIALVTPPLTFVMIDYLLPVRNWVLAFVLMGIFMITFGLLGVAHAIGWKTGSTAFRTCAYGFDMTGVGLLVTGVSLFSITVSAFRSGSILHRHSGVAIWAVWAIFVFFMAHTMRSIGNTVAAIEARQRRRLETGWIEDALEDMSQDVAQLEAQADETTLPGMLKEQAPLPQQTKPNSLSQEGPTGL